MDAWLVELRHAVRRLRLHPAATLVAILTLSAGIGAASTMFVLFRTATDDLPRMPGAERLARVWIADRLLRESRLPPSPAERRAWIEAPPRGLAIAAQIDGDATIDSGRVVNVRYVTTNFFDLLATTPDTGRTFSPDTHGVVVSANLWDSLARGQRRLGATLLVDGTPRVLIGVMPAGFGFPGPGADAWLPIDDAPAGGSAVVIARLAPGVTEAQASSMLSPVVAAARGTGAAAHVVLLTTESYKRSASMWIVLMAPALVVLAAVCANVALLLVGHARSRQAELATRAALGAGRLRMMGEAVADATVLGCAAGAAALIAGSWTLDWARAAFRADAPDFARLIPAFDAVWPVILCAVVVTIALVSCVPALDASRTATFPSSGAAVVGRSRRGGYGAVDLLLMLQVAVAAALVLWSASLSRAFDQLRAVPSHVASDRIWSIPMHAVRDGAMPRALADRVLTRAKSAPGIEAAALQESRGRRAWSGRANTDGETSCAAALMQVSDEFFALHNFPRTGALPRPGEIVLNVPAVQRCATPDHLRQARMPAPPLRVAGSVDDRVFAANVPFAVGGGVVYTPLLQPEGRRVVLLVRSRTNEGTIARGLRDGLAAEFTDLRFGEAKAMAAALDRVFSATLVIERILGALAALALVLGVVGLYGAIAQTLARRTREIAVRVALGAARRHVLQVTTGHHAAAAALGVAAGAAVSLAALLGLATDDAELIRSLVLVAASSPMWWLGLGMVLIVWAVLASAAPVLRALRIDPAATLRHC